MGRTRQVSKSEKSQDPALSSLLGFVLHQMLQYLTSQQVFAVGVEACMGIDNYLAKSY